VQGTVFVWALTQLYDRTQLIALTSFQAHTEYITRILLSPDVKKLATCSADHTAKIWKVVPMEPEEPDEDDDDDDHHHHTGLSQTNGGGVGGGSKNNPMGVKRRAYPLEATLTGHQRWVWDCAFSADSAYLVTACSDHYARLWELHSQQIIRQYNGHHRGAVCVALNDYSEAR